MTLPDDQLVEMQRRMLRIRLFDERAAELRAKAMIPGAVHTSIGHEAAVVGACAAIRGDDYITGFHRSHSHPIAKGAALGPLMAELFGKATGVCRGKGGSMHLADFSVGSLGESGIVGAGIPIAVGAALSAHMRESNQVCLCFFGDAAANTGPFHEALNLAAVWKLPVVFLCENNEYGISLPISEAMAIEDVADRAPGYGMPGVVVDGQDVLKVHAAVSDAVAVARGGGGPTLVEAKTYRFREHEEMGALKLSYRSDEEVEQRRQRDPVVLFRRELAERGVLGEEAADRLQADVAAEVEQAIAFAQESPLPDPEQALEDLFAVTASSPPPAAAKRAPEQVTRTPERPASPARPAAQQPTYLEACMQGIAAEMRRDQAVFFMGEDIRLGLYGGFPVDEFPTGRVRNTPISEAGFVGAGIGAAMTGMRPVIQMGFATFLYSAMDQVVNQAAKIRYMTGGQARVPLVLLAPCYYSGGIAAHHSDRPYALFANSPGLKLAVPSTPADMRGLMVAAIREDDPVIVFSDASLWGVRGPVADDDRVAPLGVAEVRREGSDVTVVGIAGGVSLGLAAADRLAEEGLSVEVVDPRSLVPFDADTVAASVAKTGRLVVVDPGPRTSGFAAEIVATVTEACERHVPFARVTGADVPTPFSPPLERYSLPDAARVEAAVRRLVAHRPATAQPATEVTR